jgi:hypothetical protein
MQPVPAVLTTPVPMPQLAGDTNGDLAALVLALQQALRNANDQLSAIAGLGKDSPAH